MNGLLVKRLCPAPATQVILCMAWYGHVMRRDETNISKRIMNMNFDGWKGRGRPKKRWMDCVKKDMSEKGVNDLVTSDRKVWKDKIYCADPK